MSHRDSLPLDGVAEGETVELVAVRAKGPSALRLVELGLSPSTEITVLKAARGQPLIIRVRDSSLAIDRHTAGQISVRRLRRRGGRAHHRGPHGGRRRGGPSGRRRWFADRFRAWIGIEPQARRGRRRAKRKKKNESK